MSTDVPPRGTLRVLVAGVPVLVTPGWWLAAVVLVVVGTTVTGAPLATVVAVGVALQAGVLVHEAGHAVAARARDLRVEHVTLAGIGAYTAVDTRRASAGDTAVVALAGPAVNLTVAGLTAAAVASGAVDVRPVGGVAADPVRTTLVVHLTLGLVNLLPGTPFDGGAVLAAVVRRVTGSRRAGLAAAARAGLALTGTATALVVALPAAGVVRVPWPVVALTVVALALVTVPAAEQWRAARGSDGRGRGAESRGRRP